jgi:hypothetical protein
MIYSRARLTILFVCLLFVAGSISVYAQAEKELVSKFRKALLKTADISGADLPKIIKGHLIVAGIEHGATIYFPNRGTQRMELTLRNDLFVTFENDSIHWEYNSRTKQYEFEPKSYSEMRKLKARQVEFDFATTDLLNYKALSFGLKFLGVQRLDSVDVFALELKKPDQTPINYYLNIKTHLLYKVVSNEGYQAYANYKVFDGYVFPTFMISKLDNAIERGLLIKEVRINANIPDSLLMIPKEIRSMMGKR